MKRKTELDKLRKMLDKEGIPYENDDEKRRKLSRIKYPNKSSFICSAICGDGSYGGEYVLIEIMGLLTRKERRTGGEVAGYLTADDVFERIKKDYERRQVKE